MLTEDVIARFSTKEAAEKAASSLTVNYKTTESGVIAGTWIIVNLNTGGCVTKAQLKRLSIDDIVDAEQCCGLIYCQCEQERANG